ncbi:ABC transporter substrate-binding protein [Rhodoligotrophos defluvii]|uniref:ABC transporter substrate-binding protein n=1 Tax=Rhodoligotrophos defluvii TaxID=2561934 RepID=UPI0010C938AC|nr:ABC transporter substrate-binding protein [Rhodoligotrophos defluvii]
MKRLFGWILAAGLVATMAAGAAQAEGTLRVAVPSNVNTLDPAKTKIGEEYIINNLVFSGLTESDPKGQVKPDLAESWTASDDLKTWTFKLRDGVKFHDGRPLEAEDVKATIERVMDKATASVARVNFSIVEAIETPDKNTVVFKLTQPYAGFAEILADRQVRIVPRDKLDTIASKPIGTGPFKLDLFQPGDRFELSKNADYYNPDIPKLDKILIRIIPERAAQFAALENGEIDLIWDVPPETISQYKDNPNVEMDSIATSTWDGVILNANQKPFDDQRVRKAVSLALDRQGLVDIALFGAGTPTHTMIPPTHPYYNSDLPITKPDIAQAKALLAEAGYADGFEIPLYVPSGRPTRERLGLGVAEMLKPIGIRAEIQRVPWDKFVKDIEGKAAFFIDGFYSRPTIDTSIYPWYHSTGSWNTTLWNYSNPEMDKVLDAARAAKTDEERAALYKKFQEVAEASPAGIIPYVLNHTNAFSPKVKNFHSHPMMWLDLREVTVE